MLSDRRALATCSARTLASLGAALVREPAPSELPRDLAPYRAGRPRPRRCIAHFRRVAGIRPEEGRPRRGSGRGADEAGPATARSRARPGGRQGHGGRIRLHDLRPLRALPTTVFPELKEKYIDSGKVRFIMREFPLDNLAAAASMLARCAGGDKTFPLIEVLLPEAGATGPSCRATRCRACSRSPSRRASRRKLRQVPDRPEAARSTSPPAARAPPKCSACRRRRLSSSTARSLTAAPSLDEFDKVFEPLLKS